VTKLQGWKYCANEYKRLTDARTKITATHSVRLSNESLEDTLMDMACYCLMTVIEIEDAKKDGRWFDHD